MSIPTTPANLTAEQTKAIAEAISHLALADHLGDAHEAGLLLAKLLWGEAGAEAYALLRDRMRAVEDALAEMEARLTVGERVDSLTASVEGLAGRVEALEGGPKAQEVGKDGVSTAYVTTYQACPRCLAVFRDLGPGSITPPHDEPWSGKQCPARGRYTTTAALCYDTDGGWLHLRPAWKRWEE